MELRRFYSLPANTKPYLGGGESGLDVHRNDGKGWDVCIVGAHIHCSTGRESQPNITGSLYSKWSLSLKCR